MRKPKWPKTIKAVIFQEHGPEKMTFSAAFNDVYAVYRSSDDSLFAILKRGRGYVVDKRVFCYEEERCK